MTSDIRLDDEAVVIAGNVGIGTDTPQRCLHTDAGEIHSGGAAGGFSFADRNVPLLVDGPAKGERWVWYAAGGAARLWSGADGLVLQRTPTGFHTSVGGDLNVNNVVSATGVSATDTVSTKDLIASNTLLATKIGCDSVTASTVQAKALEAESLVKARLKGVIAESLRGVDQGGNGIFAVGCSNAVAVNDPKAPITEVVPIPTQIVAPDVAKPPPSPPPMPPKPMVLKVPRLALFHDYLKGARDTLVINHFQRYVDGVVVEGNLKVTGNLTHASSITAKTDVEPLSTQAAAVALDRLRPVTYAHRHSGEPGVGFIAEEMPDLLAKPGGKSIGPTDIVAVLTAAMQHQREVIAELQDRVAALERQP